MNEQTNKMNPKISHIHIADSAQPRLAVSSEYVQDYPPLHCRSYTPHKGLQTPQTTCWSYYTQFRCPRGRWARNLATI